VPERQLRHPNRLAPVSAVGARSGGPPRSASVDSPAMPSSSQRWLAALVCSVTVAALSQAQPAPAPSAVQRVVSLNPSLTHILVELGARDLLVGVDDYSHKQRPELSGLPNVGGLFDPSLEAVVALEPDLVVLVPSAEQRDFRGRLEGLGIRTAAFRNLRFAEVLANIADLGELVGRRERAEARIAAIGATRSAVEAVVGTRARVRCLAVLQRDPVFVAGAGSFVDEMLESAGCDNLARSLGTGYPRAALEWVIAQAPDAILDMSLGAAAGAQSGQDYWASWPTLPAVASGAVLAVDPELVTMPGPLLDRALRSLARALHGPAIDREIDARLAGMQP